MYREDTDEILVVQDKHKVAGLIYILHHSIYKPLHVYVCQSVSALIATVINQYQYIINFLIAPRVEVSRRAL